MKVRFVSKFDYDGIFQMLRNYRDSGLINNLQDCDNQLHIANILDYIRAGAGAGFVAEHEDEYLGLLLAIKTPYIWNPETHTMNELVFWVEPEYRRTRAGYILIKQYIDYCSQLKQMGNIRSFNMVRRAGTNIDYARFGFEPAEESWVQ